MFILQQVEMSQKTGYSPTCWVIFSSYIQWLQAGLLLDRHAPRALGQSYWKYLPGFWKDDRMEAG